MRKGDYVGLDTYHNRWLKRLSKPVLTAATFCGLVHVVECVAKSQGWEEIQPIERTKPSLMFAAENVSIRDPSEYIGNIFVELFNFSFAQFSTEHLNPNIGAVRTYDNSAEGPDFRQSGKAFFGWFPKGERVVNDNFESWSFTSKDPGVWLK